MKDIRIDVGVYTVLYINLTDEHFSNAKKVIFTVKNYPEVTTEAIIERAFDKAGKHEIIITPEESIKLSDKAVYDFDKVRADDKRVKLTDVGRIVLRKGAGDCIDDRG